MSAHYVYAVPMDARRGCPAEAVLLLELELQRVVGCPVGVEIEAMSCVSSQCS